MLRSFYKRLIDKVTKMQAETAKRPASPTVTPEVETKVSKVTPPSGENSRYNSDSS